MPKILPRTALATKKPCFLGENRAILEYPLGESESEFVSGYATTTYENRLRRNPTQNPTIRHKFTLQPPNPIPICWDRRIFNLLTCRIEHLGRVSGLRDTTCTDRRQHRLAPIRNPVES